MNVDRALKVLDDVVTYGSMELGCKKHEYLGEKVKISQLRRILEALAEPVEHQEDLRKPKKTVQEIYEEARIMNMASLSNVSKKPDTKEPEYQQPKLKPGYVEDMIPIPRSVAEEWLEWARYYCGGIAHSKMEHAVKTALGEQEGE